MRRGQAEYPVEFLFGIAVTIIALLFLSYGKPTQTDTFSLSALHFQDSFERQLFRFLQTPVQGDRYTDPYGYRNKHYTYGDLLTLSFLDSSTQNQYRSTFTTHLQSLLGVHRQTPFLDSSIYRWKLRFVHPKGTFDIVSSPSEFDIGSAPSDKQPAHFSFTYPDIDAPLQVFLFWEAGTYSGPPLPSGVSG